MRTLHSFKAIYVKVCCCPVFVEFYGIKTRPEHFHTPHDVILQRFKTHLCFTTRLCCTLWCFLRPYSTINKRNCTENNLDYLENRGHRLSREIDIVFVSLIMNFPIKYSITVISFYHSDSDILGHIYHIICIASFQLNGNFTTRQIGLYIFLF